MTTPESNKYAELSRRYMGQAREELEIADFNQASEKAWGAVACGVKAVAEQREWNHRQHSLLYDAAGQIADELERPAIRERFRDANALYQNSHEGWMGEDDVESAIDSAELLVGELETVRQSPAPSFIPETNAQQKRLDRLTAGRERASNESRELPE